MSDEKFTLEQRLVGLGLHTVAGRQEHEGKLIVPRAEMEKFLELLDAANERDASTTFVIEVATGCDGTGEEMDAQDLRVLLQDAVGEFRNGRVPARVYVDRRYGASYTTAEAFQRKVDEVEKRVAWSRAVRFVDIKKV